MSRDIVMDAVVRKDSAALGQLATEFDRTASGVENFDVKMRGASVTSKELDESILQVRTQIARLHDEYLRTGDRTLLGDVRKADITIRQLERIKSNMEAIREASVMPARGLFSPTSMGILVGLGAAVAPAIGGIVAGAVTGAVGVGGIAGGIAAAAQDSRVKAAARDFGRSVSAEFFLSGQPFVDPVIRSLDTLRPAVGSAFARIFGPLADDVEPLARGAAGFLDALSEGLGRTARNAGPFITLLGTALPEIGDAIGDFTTDLSESDGALLAWQGTLQAVEATIRGVGGTFAWLSDVYGRTHEATRRSTDGLVKYAYAVAALSPGALPAIGVLEMTNSTLDKTAAATNMATMKTSAYAEVLSTEADSAKSAADALMVLTDATFGHLNAQLSAQNATLAYASGLLQLKESVRDHGTALDSNTEAGIRNQQILLGQVAAAERQRQANINAGMAVDEANAAYQGQIGSLIALATQLGFSEQAIQNLLGQYAQIPRTVTTDIITRFRTITDANYWSAYGAHLAVTQGRAGGGNVWAGELYKVNELATGRKVEMFRPAVDGTIEPIGGQGTGSSGQPDYRQLATALRGALQGIGVYLDGRQVGHMQGIDSFRYARGG